MTSKSDSSSVLRRDLNNLKYKRERMAVKIKELQVEMKLIDEKIKALEDDLSAESNKPSSSSIDATISNVIDSVMKSAASKSSTTNQHTSNNHKSKSVITTINGNHSLCNTKTSTTANNSSSSNSSMTNRSKSSTSSPSSPSSIVRATSSSLSSSSVSQKSMPVRKSSSDSSNYSRLAKSLNTASQSATGDMITPARHHGDIVGSRIPVIDSQANRNPFVTTFAVPQHLPPPPIMNDSNNWNWMAQPFVPSTSVSMSTEPHFNNWYMDREMHHHQALLTHNTSLLQPHSPQNVHRQPIHSSVSFYHAPTSATCASFETPIRPLAQMVPPVIAPTPASPVTSNPVATAQNTYHSSNKSHSVDHSDRCQSSGSSNDPAEGHEHDKITFQTLPLAFEECITLLEPQIITNTYNIQLPMSLIHQHIQKKYVIALRFCIYKPRKSQQSDRVARAVLINVNNNPLAVTKNSAKAVKCPISIGHLCNSKLNKITITLPPNNNRVYGCGVFALKKLPIGITLCRLRLTDYTRPEELTLDIIRKKFSSSSDIVSESIKVPLICPITKRRLIIPALGCKCEHVGCFEAQVFLEMNLTKDEWICPVCNRPIGAEELIRDGLTNKILSQLDTKCLQVEFFVDGTYKPVEEKKPVESNGFSLSASSSSKKTADIVCIDLSDEDEQSAPSTANQNGVSSSSQARRPLAPTTTSNYDEDTELEGETSDDGNNDDDDDEKDEFDHYVNSTCSRFRRRNRVLNMSSSDDDDNVDGGDDVVPLNVDRLNESDLLTSACDATRITLTNHFLPSFSEMIDTDLHEGARKRMRTCSSSSTSRSSGYRSSRRKP